MSPKVEVRSATFLEFQNPNSARNRKFVSHFPVKVRKCFFALLRRFGGFSPIVRISEGHEAVALVKTRESANHASPRARTQTFDFAPRTTGIRLSGGDFRPNRNDFDHRTVTNEPIRFGLKIRFLSDCVRPRQSKYDINDKGPDR